MKLLLETYGSARTATRTLIIAGEYPESVHQPAIEVHHVYVSRDADPYQLAGQLGHEMFHRWCTPNRGGGWIHEMLAELFRVDFLHAAGLDEYAERYRLAAATEAAAIPPARILTSLEPYPEWLHARVLTTGLAIRQEVGSKQLAHLATAFDESGEADFAGWLSFLGTRDATRIRGLLR